MWHPVNAMMVVASLHRVSQIGAVLVLKRRWFIEQPTDGEQP